MSEDTRFVGYVKVASVSELVNQQIKQVKLDSGKVVILVKAGDSYFALGGICNHEQWDLSDSSLDGDELICSGHGARWNLKTGQADYAVPLQPEPVYGVRVEGENIFITREPLKKS